MSVKKNIKLASLLALIATLVCALVASVTLFTLPRYTASAEGVMSDFVTAWNNAVSSSVDNAVEFKLGADWSSDNSYSFGSGSGFDAGSITVPENANIILDLNGHTINRRITMAEDKPVIKVKGTLTVKDSAGGGKITGGYKFFGGGIYVGENAVFTMESGEISGNGARSAGGVAVMGTFTMSGGKISGNEAEFAGGVSVVGTFTMNGGEISGNTATEGGGVYVSGTFTMNGGEISGHTATEGGGVYVSGTFTMSNGIITGNNVQSDMGGGGGVYVVENGIFTMESGEISRNNALTSMGGGVYVGVNGIFTMESGEIIGNKAMAGGGVCEGYAYSQLIMKGGVISDNTATESGGGVAANGTFSMSGGEISDNTASTGGGVNVSMYGSVTVSGGEISGNTASTGGGVYFFDDSSIRVNGTPIIRGNTSGDDSSNLVNFSLIMLTGALTDGAEIWLSGNVGTEITRDYSTYHEGVEPGKFFYSDNGKLVMLNSNREAYISDKNKVAIPTLANEEFTYDGVKHAEVANLDETKITVSDSSLFDCTDAGEYSVTLTLKSADSVWADGTTAPKILSWKIKGKPAVTNGFTLPDINLTGGSGTITLPDNVKVTGDLPEGWTYNQETGVITIPGNEINGEYTITLTPDANYAWADGSTDAKDFTFDVTGGVEKVTIPDLPDIDLIGGSGIITLPENVKVTGDLPDGWTYDEETGVITVPGNAINGEYSITLTPDDNCVWADGSSDAKDFTFDVTGGLEKVTIPDLPDIDLTGGSGTITLPENVKVTGDLPEGWTYDEETGVITISGDAINGEYTITLTPDANYAWADGSTDAKDFKVNITGGNDAGPDEWKKSVVPWIMLVLIIIVIGSAVIITCVSIERRNRNRYRERYKNRRN